MAALSGNSGDFVGGGYVAVLNTWSANFTRAVSDVTGFTNVGRNRLLGVYDLTGSAGGIVDDSTSLDSSNQFLAQTYTTGTTITMYSVNSTKSISANVVCESISMNVNKTGDQTITFNFSLASTATSGSPFTIVW